jgi:hypothetical protein
MKSGRFTLTVMILLVVSVPLLLGSATANNQGRGSLDRLKDALASEGFLVPQKDGVLSAVNVTDLCCSNKIPTCLYNNFNAPYMTITSLPKGPGETDKALFPDNFRLGPNEAIILSGRTPPPMTYFSYTVFLGLRTDTRLPPVDGDGTNMNAYIGDAINNLTIHTSGPPKDPFGREILLMLVADRKVAERVQEAARRAGYPPSMFNTIVLPPAILHLGVDDMADTFYLLQRTAEPEAGQALKDYLAEPQTVLRVTLQDPDWQPDPFPVPPVAVHGTGQTEMDLMPAVDALGEAIKTEYASELVVVPFPLQGFTALQQEMDGEAPGSDALYAWMGGSFKLPQPDGFVVIYGVNHAASGKATYSSLALYEDSLDLGLLSVDSPQYAGSATDYLPPEYPNVDKLFAWKLAWDCNGESHCTPIVNPGCPPLDLNGDSALKLAFRLYLENVTKTGPDYREVVYDRVLVFTP